MNYEIQGIKYPKKQNQKFSKIVSAKNETEAKEKILALVGGKEKIPRREIELKEIKEVK